MDGLQLSGITKLGFDVDTEENKDTLPEAPLGVLPGVLEILLLSPSSLRLGVDLSTHVGSVELFGSVTT